MDYCAHCVSPCIYWQIVYSYNLSNILKNGEFICFNVDFFYLRPMGCNNISAPFSDKVTRMSLFCSIFLLFQS